MYLKKLEIQGFKSFPDKTVLSFDSDVTAIVGPNGSGKSNISDALSWVMGEQSTKALRGGKMEDVIFSGTPGRSQTGYAEVSLTVDNSNRRFAVDSDELTITRRFYRSGESEYFINKIAVRLKDLNELLMDTGLGREGYSIIGQGRIDEILSAKSTDRREIFEEAAGISRYRHRKEEAERKLERTEDNLTRINDKIAELEYQVEPMRKQAEVAKKYLALKDELRGVEIGVWLENLARLDESAEKTLADANAAKEALTAEHGRLDELYARSGELGERMRGLDVDSERERGETVALEAQTAEAESAVAVLETELKNNGENIERLTAELAREADRVQGFSAQIAEKNEQRTKTENEISEIDRTLLETLKRAEGLERETGGALAEIGQLRESREEKLREYSKAQVTLAALNSTERELNDRLSGLENERTQTEEKLSAAIDEKTAAERRFNEAQQNRIVLKNKSDGCELRLQTRRERLTQINEQLSKLGVERDTMQSRIRMLEDMEREYQGYSRAVRTVMQDSDKGALRGIHGPVANLIRTDERYAYAVETALGGSAQNIVVEDESVGKAAINMLKARDAGRATFMPLSMRGGALNERGIEDERGFIGVASELAECDERYRGIIDYILGRTVIVGDIDSAIAMSRRHSARFAIVTTDGQVMNRGGSMTGGSAGRNVGIISRANELDSLRRGLSEKINEIEKQHRLSEKLKTECADAERECRTAARELRTAEDLLLSLKAELERHSVLAASIEQRMEAVAVERESIETRLAGNADLAEQLTAAIEEYKAAETELDAELDRLTEGHSRLVERGTELTEELSNLRVRRVALETELSSLTSALGELEKLREDFASGSEKRRHLELEYRRRSAELTARINEKREDAEKIAVLAAEHREKLKKLTNARLELEGERTRLERESQEQNGKILNMERESARLEQKRAAAETERMQITDKLWDNYELGPTAARQFAAPIESLAAATRRTAELKRSISALGTPNLGAITEFERINERYEFLTGQRDDVEKAKKELDGIIREVTSQMRSIFSERFRVIAESFSKTFTELFNGGRAALELENEEDILNCGIEIRVQPPGKLVKNISLLSGGEKAFVAIALYFAIIKVSPTPFCVMDEIEAALDETNVLKFAQYMRGMTPETQFVVITHRRGTMEEADTLYGVTMQEQGVSRVLMMDLNEAERRLRLEEKN